MNALGEGSGLVEDEAGGKESGLEEKVGQVTDRLVSLVLGDLLLELFELGNIDLGVELCLKRSLLDCKVRLVFLSVTVGSRRYDVRYLQ